MQKSHGMIKDAKIENIFDTKVQAAFAKAARSYQLKTFETDVIIHMIKEEELAQKLGAELHTNEHVLSWLNTAVTRYVQTEKGKALKSIRASLP